MIFLWAQNPLCASAQNATVGHCGTPQHRDPCTPPFTFMASPLKANTPEMPCKVTGDPSPPHEMCETVQSYPQNEGWKALFGTLSAVS